MSKTSHLPLMKIQSEVTIAMRKHPDIPVLLQDRPKFWRPDVPRFLVWKPNLVLRGKTCTSIVRPLSFQKLRALSGVIMILSWMTVSRFFLYNSLSYLSLMSLNHGIFRHLSSSDSNIPGKLCVTYGAYEKQCH